MKDRKMKRIKRKLTVVLSIVIFNILVFSMFANKEIQILSYNDLHGSLSEEVDGKNPGMVKLVTAMKTEKANYPNTVIVSGGDNFTGSVMSNLTYGEPVAELMQLMSVSFSAIGNHAFDWGIDKVAQWQSKYGWDYLAANIYDKNTGEPVSWAKPYEIITVNGVKIAFIGLTTLETVYKTKKCHIENLEFKNAGLELQKYVDLLKSGSLEEGVPDAIIAITHIASFQDEQGNIIGTDSELEDVCTTDGVNAVITAHSHGFISGYCNKVPVLQAGKNGRAIGKLILKFDDNNKMISVEPTLNLIYKSKNTIVPDEEALTVFNKWKKQRDDKLSEVQGVANGEFIHARYDDNVSVLGRFVCELLTEKTDTQIAIITGGALRREISEGTITNGLLYEVLPYDDYIVTMKLSGADIRRNIDHGIDNANVGNSSFYGIEVTYDSTKPQGAKITEIKLNDGTLLDNNKMYTLSTIVFMYEGGDEYDFSNAADVVETNEVLRELIVDKIKTEQVITPKPIDYMHEIGNEAVELDNLEYNRKAA
jgi:2',3'-cyclic-nucleotide 2'-phosphodiesterase (5'-nucleotidase family)